MDFALERKKNNQMNTDTIYSRTFKTITLKEESSKQQTPAIYIKTEFKTGQTDNLNDNTDQPEILKHTKAGANVPNKSSVL